jgi:CheY-like chemotaxis protein
VSDTGIGIREDDLKKLFTDYNQLDIHANRHIEGTGLGLSITKKLVDLMAGEISVESEYGKGTTFRLIIKQGFVSDKIIGYAAVESLRSFNYSDSRKLAHEKLVRSDLSYAKVLVIDDMQTNLDVAAGLLRKYKMKVDCATSGQEAISRIKSSETVYDAIFMDHMMPGMDGLETVDKIRNLETEYAKKIPIIALTANAVQGSKDLFFAHGFQDFISKPIHILHLDSVVQKWIRKKDREKALVEASAPQLLLNEKAIAIPGVDAEKGLSLYDDDIDIYLSVLQTFAETTQEVLNRLRNVSEETLKDYVINVHGVKSICANIGAQKAREKALELEMAAKAGNLNVLLAKTDSFIMDVEKIISDIKTWLEQ